MRKSRRRPPSSAKEWLDHFTESLTKADMSPRTVSGYRHDLETFLRWYSESRAATAVLGDLSTVDLINFRQHLVKVQRLKPATVNRRLQALRRLCRWATRRGWLAEDPSQEVKTIRVQARRQPIGLHEPEAHALLRVAGQSGHGLARRNYALMQLMVQTGLRVSEVASLLVDDATVHARSGSIRVREGKGRKARDVPLNATARRAVRQYLESREEVTPDEALFFSKRGTPMSIRSVQAVVTELGRRAKIERVRVSAHTLRHTFALNYLKHNPGKLVELASLLGHESLDTTAIYTRPSAEDLAADLERSPLNVYD
jgi:site-specific recombinase XerD